MIDLDTLVEYAENCEKKGVICALTGEVLIALIERLREAEKDAERYRWLLDDFKDNSMYEISALPPSQWDAFIDDAIAQQTAFEGE